MKPNVGHKPEQIWEKLGNKIYYRVAVGPDLNTFAETEVWWKQITNIDLVFNLGKYIPGNISSWKC